MSILDAVFPEAISAGATFGEFWRVDSAQLKNGAGQNVPVNSKPLGVWTMSHSTKDKVSFQELRNFWLAVGCVYGFLIKDWTDYESDTQQSCSPATGDGSNLTFQLQKTYTTSAPLTANVRTIAKPKQGTLAVFVNGVQKVEGANPGGDYQPNYSTGAVVFNAGKAPPNGHTVKATFQYYKMGEFDMRESSIEVEQEAGDNSVFHWNSIRVREVYQ